MNIVTCPGLRLISSTNAAVIVEHPWTGACYSLEPLYASLLELLKTPENLEVLCGKDGTVPQHIITHLMRIGLLVDADNPSAAANNLLRRSLPTFLRCPEGDAETAQVCVIGVPFDGLSDTGAGAAGGPGALRLAASFPTYEINDAGIPLGWFDYYSNQHVLKGVSFTDAGDIPVRIGDSPEDIGKRLSSVIQTCQNARVFPLILGGDHSLTYWAIAALSEKPLSILHLDAHSDLGSLSSFNLPTNGSVMRAVLENGNVEHLVSIGVRGFLPILQHSFTDGHKIVSANEVKRTSAEEIIALLPEDCPCYVSLDIDVLDPSVAPGTNALVPNGLLFEEVRVLLQEVGRRRNVIGADLVELNPQKDPQMLTARAGIHLILSLLAAVFSRREDLETAQADVV
jgi:agmatinase